MTQGSVMPKGNLSNKTFRVLVFGCQMNRNDAELVRGLLAQEGAIEVSSDVDADIIVFMTCCVREKADTRVMGQVSSLKNLPVRNNSSIGKRIVALGGCIGQRDGEKLQEILPNVDVVFGTHNIEDLPSLIEKAITDGGVQTKVLDDRKPYDRFEPKVRESKFHAWLPIMKGCNNFCTYCIVPYVRGREMSRTIEDVVADAKSLVADGVKEITLLGQNVNSYGRDLYGEPKFAEILHAVAETGISRLRFVTSHPKDLSDQTIAAIADIPSVMPYLHLPVQSGSDRILKAMNRRYSASHYLSLIDKVRDAVGDIALSTDIIVGFPGETDEDFEQTYELVKKVGYSQVFTFIYSKREGTPAAKIVDDTPREQIQARFDKLVEVVQQSAYEQNQHELDQTVEVLVEGTSDRDQTKLTGKSPKNQTVHFEIPAGKTADDMIGNFANVHIDVCKTWYLSGTFVGNSED